MVARVGKHVIEVKPDGQDFHQCQVANNGNHPVGNIEPQKSP